MEILNETRRLIGRISALRRLPGSRRGRFLGYCPLRGAIGQESIRSGGSPLPGSWRSSARAACTSRCRRRSCAAAPSMDAKRTILIETCGIRVTADDLCTGLRHFDGWVDATLDPLRGIARRYLQRQFLRADEGTSPRVGRVIVLRTRATPTASSSSPSSSAIWSNPIFRASGKRLMARASLAASGTESLNGRGGQLRTRIQAFAEMMEKRR